MKFFCVIIFFVIFQHCSFDDKTGIWKNENNISKKDNDLFKEFETMSTSDKIFNQTIPIKKNYKFILSKPLQNLEWQDIFFNSSNNFKNFKYNNLNKLIFKSNKISKYKTNNNILFEKNHLITSDEKGNVITYSINEKKIISKFNFYKKKHKNIKKKLNLIIERNIIYVSDNIGYLYAYNYKTDKILWAKYYKVPFRSNLKLSKNKLIASSHINNLFYFDKTNGNILKSFPTEEIIVQNEFINNLSLNNDSLFFLNSYGSLYSIDNQDLRIKWFVNLNQSLDLTTSNLFTGTQIINNKNKIIISSNKSTYIIDSNDGSILYKSNIISQIKPVIFSDHLFLITKNNLLVVIELNSLKIIYSQNINEKIAKFLNTDKKLVEFKEMFIVNNNIYIFLKNSYLLKFNLNGDLVEINKLPSKINSKPIFINGSLLYLDFKKKLSIID
jgi:outer membrane protein assembly factor BamB